MVLTAPSDPSDPLVMSAPSETSDLSDPSAPRVISDPSETSVLPELLVLLVQRVVTVKSVQPVKKDQPVLEIHYLSGLQVRMVV